MAVLNVTKTQLIKVYQVGSLRVESHGILLEKIKLEGMICLPKNTTSQGDALDSLLG